jgi:hypothetical protein
MSPDGNRPCTADELDDPEQVAWTAARALLNAQETGNRALEDYLLMLSLDRNGTLGPRDLDSLLGDAIAAHTEIVEDLECARELLDELQVAETP